MKPRIGKAVHYRSRGSADGVFPPECRAALITKVIGPGIGGGYSVDVVTFHHGGIFFDHGLEYDEDMTPGTWHYPDHDDDLPEDPGDEGRVSAKLPSS